MSDEVIFSYSRPKTLKVFMGKPGLPGKDGTGTGAEAWQGNFHYAAGTVVEAPDGSMISRNADGNSNTFFDAAEQAKWTAVSVKPGTIEHSALAAEFVPLVRKINGKDLSSDIILSPEDIGALGFIPGVSASGIGPGNGVDQWQAITDHMAAIGSGRTKRLPLGFIPISKPLIIPPGVILEGSGAPINTGTVAFAKLTGTIIVPTSNFSSPVVDTDSAGGNISTGPTLSVWVNGVVQTIQLYTYTTLGSTLPPKFSIGQFVSISGGTGVVPSNCEILDVQGNTLTLGPGCTPGSVTSMTTNYGSLLVIEAAAAGVEGAGIRDLSAHVAGKAIPRAACLGGQFSNIDRAAFFGGTLTPLDVTGQGTTFNNIRAQRYTNTTTYAPLVGPFAARFRGADHSGVLIRVGSGTTVFGCGGQFSTLNLGTATPGGPAVLINNSSGGALSLQGLEANNSGGSTGASCLIQRGLVMSGEAAGTVTLQGLNAAGYPVFNTPLIVDETTLRGSIRVSGAILTYSSTAKWTSLVKFINGGNPRTTIEDFQTTGPSGWITTVFEGGSGTARNIWDGTLQLATDSERITLASNPDSIIVGTITRDANGAATSADVVWPDGTPGTYTADTMSTLFPGAVDGYHITYGSPVTATYTQPTVTRDDTGAVINRPAMVVS